MGERDASAPGGGPGSRAEPSAPGDRPGRPEGGTERRPDLPDRKLLDGQSAATDELRQSIEELRQLLDVQPMATGTPAEPGQHRRGPLFLAAGLAAAVIAGAALLVTQPWQGDGGTTPVTTASGPTGTRGSGPTSSASSAPVRGAGLQPDSAPRGGLPTAGAGIDAPGASLYVTTTPEGSLDVVERVLLPRAVARIGIRTPPDLDALEGDAATLTPRVGRLKVSLDGVPVTPSRSLNGGWSVYRGTPSSVVQLSYRLDAATVRSTPSSSGRALALVLPLLGWQVHGDGLPLSVYLPTSVGARNVTCPGAPSQTVVCGTETPNGWTANVPAGADAAVLVQLDLPADPTGPAGTAPATATTPGATG